MALINCPECSKQISDTSQKCIGCGFKINDVNKKSNKKLKIILIVVIALVTAVLYLASNSGNESNSSSNNSKDIYSDFTPSQTKIDNSISLESVNSPKLLWYLINEVDNIQDGKAYDVDGNYLGSFSDNGQKNGDWKQYYSLGYEFISADKTPIVAYVGNYTNGLMNGNFKYYYPDGTLKHEGYYKDGTHELNENNGIPAVGREGLHIFYYNNGAVSNKHHFLDGKAEGLHEDWHKNGIKKREANYRNDYIEGKYQEWDDKGNCIKKGRFTYQGEDFYSD